jgi:transcriptional regulator with XRE-family HTH domain
MTMGSITPPRPLPEELQWRRRRARLSQRDLAKLGGLNWSTVQVIEQAAKGGKERPYTRPDTIRKLAIGLAKDADGQVDDEAFAEHYRALMRAAGHTDVVGVLSDPKVLANELQRLLGRHDLGVAFASAITDWNRLDLADQEFIVRAIRSGLRRANAATEGAGADEDERVDTPDPVR